MIIIIIGLCVLGAFEAHIYHKDRYPEDVTLAVAAFGIAAFLGAFWLNGGMVW